MLSFSHDPHTAEQQMNAIIFSLTAFGYIDGDFDSREKQYVREYVARLVDERARQAMPDQPDELQRDLVSRWTRHFHDVADEIDHEIAGYFSESVGEGETAQQFVVAKLKLRCFELFTRFDEENRAQLLATVDELIHADGVVHPSEATFRDQLAGLLDAPTELDEDELEPIAERGLVIARAAQMTPRQSDHPFLKGSEWDYARDPVTFAAQAEGDMNLIRAVMAKLAEQRERGRGRLDGPGDFTRFAGSEPFLDGHVYVLPPQANQDYELLVIGDLHGCYSCLKAALLQADFFAKVEAHHLDPERNPATKLVLLGDYIDRGRYSYNGILRTAMQLFLSVPDDVYLLRGNHEYYVEINGQVLSPVRPAEAMAELRGIAPNALFESYMHLFEALPNMLVFDRTLFVHAGIPRDATLDALWRGLETLNDPDLRFEMLWSDPSDADVIPDALQAENARFPFGRKQFRNFMARLGCTTLVRGHERISEGFREIYSAPDARLLSLFSAGGEDNHDLPPESNYREVTPMALTIRHRDGVSEVTPFVIEYERFNDPEHNAFLQASRAGT